MLCQADVSDYARTGRYAETDGRLRADSVRRGPQHHGRQWPQLHNHTGARAATAGP